MNLRFWVGLLLIGVVLGGLSACASTQPPPPTATPTPSGPIVGNPQRGRELFDAPALGLGPGCSACHSLSEGVDLVGPSLAHIASLAAQRLQDASYTGQATSVEAYLREAIVDPDAYLPPGYEPGAMYGRYGEELSAQEIADLVAFLASLK